MTKIFSYIKTHKLLSLIAVLVVGGIGVSLLRPDPIPDREIVTASRQTISQQVEVTGRVEPVEKIDLAVETGGKVRTIGVKVGDSVLSGDVLLQVDSGELSIRLSKQQSALSKARLALSKLEKPAKSVDILQAENDLSAALEAQQNAQDDLAEAYESGFNSVTDAFLDIPSSLSSLEDLLGMSNLSYSFVRSIYGDTAAGYREDANNLYLDADAAYQDVEKYYRNITRNSDPQELETLIIDSYEAVKLLSDAIKALNNLLDYIERRATSMPASLVEAQATLDDVTGEVNVHNVSLLEAKSLIKTSADDISVTTREVSQKRAELEDVLAGAESEDLQSARLTVQEAELDIQETQLLLGDRIIRSPISGTVTEISVNVGEILASGAPAISVISSNTFQIAASLPESDIFKIDRGSQAVVTLDAYGLDREFKATVSSINPAEILLEGVAAYEMTLLLAEEDAGIRSGMTADITIIGESKEGVIAVPQRAVITRANGKFVRVLEDGQEVEKQVTTGMRGADGNVEILSGLSEGEQVIVFSEEE